MNKPESPSNREISIDASKIPTTADTSPATFFDPSEVSKDYWNSSSDWYRTKKESYFKHLEELNQGKKVVTGRYNTRYETYMLNRELIEAVSTQLDLTQQQQSKAKNLFLSLDLEDLGLRAEVVAYAVCQYVVHSDDTDERQCHPMCCSENVPDQFIAVRNSLKINGNQMDSVYGKIQNRF